MVQEEKYNLISLLEIMSHLEKEEIEKLRQLPLQEVEKEYNLIHLEKTDEMLEEDK